MNPADPGAKAERALSPRERQVLALMATGAPDGEIASRLSIRKSTVRTHVKSICGKLSAPGRLQATLWAVKNLRPPV
jgi:DNA-binding CsgD family transcriptional regulator